MFDTFMALFVAGWVGHYFGDHWVQTGQQTLNKGLRGSRKETRRGQAACLRHVLSLQATKAILFVAVWWRFDVDVNPWWAAAAVLADGASHFALDRKWTVAKLAQWVRKTEFHDLGSDTLHAGSPRGSHIGTGRYALDQSAHVLCLFAAAFIGSL